MTWVWLRANLCGSRGREFWLRRRNQFPRSRGLKEVLLRACPAKSGNRLCVRTRDKTRRQIILSCAKLGVSAQRQEILCASLSRRAQSRPQMCGASLSRRAQSRPQMCAAPAKSAPAGFPRAPNSKTASLPRRMQVPLCLSDHAAACR
jgi:hypothetical protein